MASMRTYVTQHADASGWDIATSIGTIAAAIATAAAVIAAFVVAQRERTAAAVAQDALHTTQREKEAREHEIDLLLVLGRLVGEYRANPTSGAHYQGRAIASALPTIDGMPGVQVLFLGNTQEHLIQFERTYGRPGSRGDPRPRL